MMCWLDASLREPYGYAANFLKGPADKRRATKDLGYRLLCWHRIGPMTDRGHHCKIPILSGRVFRREAGRHYDLMPDAVPR